MLNIEIMNHKRHSSGGPKTLRHVFPRILAFCTQTCVSKQVPVLGMRPDRRDSDTDTDVVGVFFWCVFMLRWISHVPQHRKIGGCERECGGCDIIIIYKKMTCM